ncbi:MAG: acyl-CoA dehydrogenase [Actinomycetota bacterium]|nr:MAG: acyl-CoA dehydrogenase [Actinomycetota bacterium]
MNFAFNEEQEEFRRSVRRFLQDKSPISEVRRLMETEEGFDPAVWSQMANQLGLTGVTIPEKFGGLGYGQVELGIVFEETGRALLCAPYFSTVALGVNLLLESGDESACSTYLPFVSSGEVRLAVAAVESQSDWSVDDIKTVSKGGAEAMISGSKPYVIDGLTATHILVLAANTEGTSLYVVEGSDPSLRKTFQPSLDQTRKLASLTFDSTPGRLIGSAGEGSSYYERMLTKSLISLASEQVGGAQRVLEMAVDYAKTRIQFDRPIGSFQAIKHKCADMLVGIESAKSAAYYGSWVVDNEPAELPAVAYLAKAFCSEAYFSAAAENIQIHGGIGFTWEHDAHLYFKRAKASEIMFGPPAFYREKLAQTIGL